MISGAQYHNQQEQQQQQNAIPSGGIPNPQTASFRQRLTARIAYYRVVLAGYKQWVYNKLTGLANFLAHFITNFGRMFRAVFDLVKNVATFIGDIVSNITNLAKNTLRILFNNTLDTIRFLFNNTLDTIRFLFNKTLDAISFFVDHIIDSIKWVARKLQTAITTACFVLYGVCAVTLDFLAKDMLAGALGVGGIHIDTSEDSLFSKILEGASLGLACIASAALVYFMPPAAFALVVSSSIYKEIYPDTEEDHIAYPNPNMHNNDDLLEEEEEEDVEYNDVLQVQPAAYVPQLASTIIQQVQQAAQQVTQFIASNHENNNTHSLNR